MKRVTALVLSLIISLPLLSWAEDENAEQVASIIDAVTNAYGGDALRNMKTFRSENRYITINIGQGHSPERLEASRNNIILTVDLEANRFVFETWADARAGYFQSATVVEGEVSTFIDYMNNRQNPAPQNQLHLIAGGTLRTNDTFLVYEMNQVKDQVTLLGEEEYMGRTHTKLNMPFPGSPDLVLFIDNETRLINRMLRVNPQVGDLDYVYGGHEKTNGVTSATNISFSIAGEFNILSAKHKMEVGVTVDDELFNIPEGIPEAGERTDGTVPVVNKINDNVYHVGQGNGFSLFAKTSDGLVGAGGYPGIGTRLAQYHSESGAYYPLAYQVVTHHHNDHLGGIGEAAAMGAKLLTPASNFDVVKETVTDHELEDSDFVAVGPRTTLGEGRNRVELYEVSTAHSDAYLLVYVPSAKTIFTADHTGSPFKEGLPNMNRNITSMHKVLVELDLDVKKIVTAHSPRVFTFKEMEDAVSSYEEKSCVAERPVCG